MSQAPCGEIRFPGINQMLGGTYTLSHGISPSYAICRITPQNNFAVKGGDMEIVYGNERPIVFKDCRLDTANLDSSTNSRVWTIRIADRRWKWQFGEISGVYNKRRPNGRIDNATEKSPRELIELLLAAMGEFAYGFLDITPKLQNNVRPYVEWQADNPAEMLARLCDSLGLRVVLGLDNRAHICKLGDGASLPKTRIMSGGYSFDPPETPDSLKLVCGPTQFQARIELEAVGLEIDGTVKLLKDLSYNPANQNAVQTITFSQTRTGGTYTITLNGSTTDDLAFDATAETVQAALEGIVGSDNVTVTGGTPYFTVTFGGAFKHTPVGLMEINTDALEPDGVTGTAHRIKAGLSGEGEPYGWAKEDPETMTGLIGTDTLSAEIRSLALKTVYKWYRIKQMATGDLNVPGYGLLKNIRQILPLREGLLDTESGIINLGERYPQPQHARVYGKFYGSASDPPTFVNRPFGTQYPGSFTLDTERGIVQFSNPVYQVIRADSGILASDQVTTLVQAGSFAYLPANLVLECVFNVHDYDTRAPVRHTVTKEISNQKFNTKPKILKRDDIYKTVQARYASLGNTDFGITDTTTFEQAILPVAPLTLRKPVTNETGVVGFTTFGVDAGLNGKCRYYLEKEQAIYKPKTAISYKYLKIMPISPDGRIHQITWTVGESGATTEASENDEFKINCPSYDERRIAEMARQERVRISNGGMPRE